MTGPIGQTPQSFRGYIGLGKESTYAEGVAPTIFVDATSDGEEADVDVDVDEESAQSEVEAELEELKEDEQ